MKVSHLNDGTGEPWAEQGILNAVNFFFTILSVSYSKVTKGHVLLHYVWSLQKQIFLHDAILTTNC